MEYFLMIKANFKISKSNETDKKGSTNNNNDDLRKDLTKSEFEEFIVKSGAAGSFMVFRSEKKKDELGLDQL
jgi:hypothetical protein